MTFLHQSANGEKERVTCSSSVQRILLVRGGSGSLYYLQNLLHLLLLQLTKKNKTDGGKLQPWNFAWVLSEQKNKIAPKTKIANTPPSPPTMIYLGMNFTFLPEWVVLGFFNFVYGPQLPK